MIRQNERLTDLIQPVVMALGYELWGLEYRTSGDSSLLRIYIDQDDGISVDDCQKVSQQVVGVLDVEDPIPGAYNLEVSSPGLDRLLFTAEQCEQFIGREVKIRLNQKLEGRRRYMGKISSVTEKELVLVENEELIALPLASIETIRLKPELD